MGLSYSQLVGNPPRPGKSELRPWYFRYLAARQAQVPLERATRYYVAANGSDSNSGLTTALPFLTLVKVQTVLTASSGDVRFSFRDGDAWEESAGLTIAKNDVTLDVYSLDATTVFKVGARFSRFLLKYNSTGWALASGNRYTRTEASTVALLRYQSNHFNPILIRCTSAAECEATSNSYAWVSNVLHINLGGTNPNTINLEAAADNSVIGVDVQNVDGFRMRGIRVEGYGASASNAYTIKIANSNLMVAIIENCEAYYGGYHLMGHNEGQTGVTGGVCIFSNCRVGLAYKGGAGACWVSHNGPGGQETVWHCCEAAYGAVPESSWYTATVLRYGSPIYGHTGGGSAKIGLAISYGMHIANNSFGCESGAQFSGPDSPAATTLEDVRIFIIGEQMLGVQPCGTMNFGIANHAWINCEYHLTLMTGVALQNVPIRGWLINCKMTVEKSGLFTNNGAQGEHYPRIWHCRMSFPKPTWHTMFYGTTASQLAGTTPAPSIFNSIVMFDPQVSTGTAAINTRNYADNLGGNAYFAMYRYTTGGGDEGYSADTLAVRLTNPPAEGVEPDSASPLFGAGTTLPGEYTVEHDMYWRTRPSPPSVGPLDGLSTVVTAPSTSGGLHG